MFFDRLHENQISPRRLRRLAEHLAQVLPLNAEVLDVGCGDGRLSAMIAQRRQDLTFTGLEVLVRDKVHIPVQQFDGENIPCSDDSFDVAMLVDVLHHTDDPTILLREAMRVSRAAVVIKDHVADGLSSRIRLRLMDYVGNARFGVRLPYNYWPSVKWEEAWRELGLEVSSRESQLGLYPWPASLVFDANLHFLASLKLHKVAA